MAGIIIGFVLLTKIGGDTFFNDSGVVMAGLILPDEVKDNDILLSGCGLVYFHCKCQ
jgi:hypothetical protein